MKDLDLELMLMVNDDDVVKKQMMKVVVEVITGVIMGAEETLRMLAGSRAICPLAKVANSPDLALSPLTPVVHQIKES